MSNNEYVMVVNEWGVKVYYNSAVMLMDDKIREDLHRELAPYTEQVFFDAYCKRHEDIFGEVWELAKENPCY